MTEIWMFTAPYKVGILKEIAKMWRDYDGKKFQIGIEKGRSGYRHVQGRIQISNNTQWERPISVRNGRKKNIKMQKGSYFFDRCSLCGIHCEQSTEWGDYESKEGYFIRHDDTKEVRAQRFGTPTYTQEAIINALHGTNDRQVMLWLDEEGGIGKSWITGHLWEKHQAHYIRMTGTSAESMIKDTASKMEKERRPIVIIDIPRATKWNNQLYEAIEVIKDGLIDDPRYSSHALNIRGTKVLVMSNTKPDLDKLSKDRWYTAKTYTKYLWNDKSKGYKVTKFSKPRP